MSESGVPSSMRKRIVSSPEHHQTAKTALEVHNSQGVEFDTVTFRRTRAGWNSGEERRVYEIQRFMVWNRRAMDRHRREFEHTFQEAPQRKTRGMDTSSAGSTKTIFDRGYADKNKGNGFLHGKFPGYLSVGSEPRVDCLSFTIKKRYRVNNCQQFTSDTRAKASNRGIGRAWPF
jgi:hypothetical protein